MNSKNYIENLKGIFGDVTSVTPEKLQEFVGDTMKQLFDLKEKLESKDEKIREEGLKAASEMKEVLESQLDNIAKLMSEENSELAALLNQAGTSQEEEILKNANEQFMHLKKSLSSGTKTVNKPVSIIG